MHGGSVTYLVDPGNNDSSSRTVVINYAYARDNETLFDIISVKFFRCGDGSGGGAVQRDAGSGERVRDPDPVAPQSSFQAPPPQRLRPVVLVDYGGTMPQLQENLCGLLYLARQFKLYKVRSVQFG
uniref:Uncharacterized protein n=2 Tax=Zea mays TaxID=4577 RepID=A0A804Q7W7_MAIZE